jgi:hypothetical protein
MFVLARYWRRFEQFTVLAHPTRTLAWAGLASLIAFNVTKGVGLESIDGVAQRAFALCVLI